jgi:hypothetical protein
MANRGGATGQVQNTTLAPTVDSTSADRSRANARGRHQYSQASVSGVRMKCSSP